MNRRQANRRRLLAAILSSLLLGCAAAPSDEGRSPAGNAPFSWELPEAFEPIPGRRGDSASGALQDATMELYYDYGPYAGPLGTLQGVELSREEVRVGPREALLVAHDHPGAKGTHPHRLVLHMADVGNGDNMLTLSAWCRTEEARTRARRILESVRLDEDQGSH